jgi:signal transduction histidine kinase
LRQRDDSRDAYIVELLEDGLHGCTSATTILNDMLSHEAIEAGKYSINPDTLPAVETVESIVRNIKSVGNAKNVRLVLDNRLSTENSESLVFQVDQPKLEQVFLNIASNSVKFSPEGSELTISLSMSSENDDGDNFNDDMEDDLKDNFTPHAPFPCSQELAYAGALTISFVDNGVGINPEDLKKVFSEFTQFNSNKLQGGRGSGLGLFITRNIIKCHNGTINVYSDGIGRGTRFELKLAAFKYNSSSSRRSNYDDHVIMVESLDDEDKG